MNNPPDAAPPAAAGVARDAAGSGSSQFTVARPWKVPVAAMVIMIALALVGVALTMSKSDWAPRFWMALVPIYGVLCVVTAWDRSRRDPRFQRPGILLQVFHWL